MPAHGAISRSKGVPGRLKPVTAPHRLFLLVCMLPVIALWGLPQRIVALSLYDDRYTHLAVVPLISVSLLVFNHERIFRNIQSSRRLGLFFVLLGPALWIAVRALVPSLEAVQGVSLAGF